MITNKILKTKNPFMLNAPHTTINKVYEVFSIVEDVLEHLDDVSIHQLTNGYEHDIDGIVRILNEETYDVLYGGKGLVKENDFNYIDGLSSTLEESLRINNLNYFITSTISGFEMNWHHLEWGELVMMYNKLCVKAARDHGKSYYFTHAVPIWKLYRYSSQKYQLKPKRDIALCEKGFIICNDMDLSKEHLDNVKSTIEENDVLRNRLFPDSKLGSELKWGETRIKCKNGAKLQAKSYGSRFRGRHPHYILVDDFLSDNVIYSETQRKKAIDWFESVLMNALVPGGQIIVDGTPFHEGDLYGYLEKSMQRMLTNKDSFIRKESWMVFEYPSIYASGQVLWENRYSLRSLLAKREAMGNLRFSREHLCKPIISDSSIFPMTLIRNSFIGMENHTLVKNVDSFSIKFQYVVIGCDFAISANIGSDFSVFMVFGVDERGVMWLLSMYREMGKSFGEQIAVIKAMNSNFRPDIICMETNQFQTIFAEAAEQDGLPVMKDHTGVNKYSLEDGLPSVALLFEQFKVKFPRGDSDSRNKTDIIVSELTSVTFTDKGKLEGVGAHDDTAMALWQSKKAVKNIGRGVGLGFL